MTTFDACLIVFRKGSNASGALIRAAIDGIAGVQDGRWRPPASAAPRALSAISSAVTGRWGDIDGVWIEPVTAQLMMTLDIKNAPSPDTDDLDMTMLCEDGLGVGSQRPTRRDPDRLHALGNGKASVGRRSVPDRG